MSQLPYPSSPPPYYNNQKTSFAYPSARERWPVIINQGIQDVSRTIDQLTEKKEKPEVIEEGKRIIQHLSTILDDLNQDKKLEPINIEQLIKDIAGPNFSGLSDDEVSKIVSDAKFRDINSYNEDLNQIVLNDPSHSTWQSAAWLFSECLLYRKIALPFQVCNTDFWKQFDIFGYQKKQAFRSSKDGVAELALRYKKLTEQLSELESKIPEEKGKALKVLFQEFVDVSLWGNATDLSLLTNVSLEDIKHLQGEQARRKNEANILVNDTEKAWEAIYTEFNNNNEGGNGARVDIVLDNAGFELYTDLVFGLFLLDSGLINTLVLHPKDIPWFVSDVLPHDVLDLLNDLTDPEFFAHSDKESREALDFVAEKLISYTKNEVGGKKIEIRTSPFWTTQYGYSEIKANVGKGGGAQVWEDLKDSSLVIFKGDLNHRKLLWDLQWDRTTPFTEAIGDLKDSGIRLVTFRTCKGDVVVGLKPGQQEELEQAWKSQHEGSTGREWSYSGKWAVIEYSEGA